MTVRNLEFLFHPRSIAVVAEPDVPGKYAEVVLRNLAEGGFDGPIVSVAAKKRSHFGLGAHIHIDQLKVVPDLAIVCAALADVPDIVKQLGERGTRAVIVGPSIRDRMNENEGLAVRKAILDAAHPHMMRLLGSGSGGIAVPARGLNASVTPVAATPGKIALVTESTSIATAVLDRAYSKGIGFSTVVHLGAGLDIDLADVLDWLAGDPGTEAILVQFDSVTNGRKFMSAARAAARNKAVVAIRGGAIDHPRAAGAPFGSGDVYETALRRAGWVCIDTLEDLFEAVEALAHARARSMRGGHLCILGNGLGLGHIAAHALRRSGGQLATLAHDTATRLNKLLGTHATLENPLVLPADVTPANWAASLQAVLADPDTNAVLTVCSPSPFVHSAEVAAALCEVAKDAQRNVFTCWVGGASMREAQKIAAANGVLSHESPEQAIGVFLSIMDFRRNRNLLMQMPPSLSEDFTPDVAAARSIVAEAIQAQADALTSEQARRLMQAYGIEVGAASPPASTDGAALRLGVANDPVFGPVIFFGKGRSVGHRNSDLVVALPPLNLTLAQDMVARSRFADDAPDAQCAALEAAAGNVLVRVSQLLTDIHEVAELELAPLQIGAAGAVVQGARVRIERRSAKKRVQPFAIRPYPKELEQQIDWDGQQLLIRPIRPEDETALGDLLNSLSPEDARMRFFGAMHGLPRTQLARFTQIDYDREMALVAIERDSNGVERSLGEVRVVADPDNRVADFAIVIDSTIKGKGLGRLLMQSIVDYARSRGIVELRGETMVANTRMQHLAKSLGFKLKQGADVNTVDLHLSLLFSQHMNL